MPLPPPYIPENLRVVHNLHYDWTGCISKGHGGFPNTTTEAVNVCVPLWEKDGLKLEKWSVKASTIQILFKALPHVSPQECTRFVKGRLQHVLRKLDTPVKFSRKVGFRSLGDNTRKIVKKYIVRQAQKSNYIDPKFKKWLDQYNFTIPKVQLERPVPTASGRYWYALHLVIVVENRTIPMTMKKTFDKVANTCFSIARKKGYEIAEMSIMPDHIHISLRGDISSAPELILASFMNNLWKALNVGICWSYECYAGTFSEYRLDQIR
jgi:REP element-mobilizing transposase RayT